MNILLVGHEKNLGGASRSLVTLASELQEKGHRVTVVLPLRSGQVYPKLQKSGIKVKKIFFGWWMCPIGWNPILKMAFRILHGMEWIAASRIAAYTRKNHIQIIHSNSSAIDVGALAAQKAGVPHVWHFREFGDLDYDLKFMLGRKRSCQKINSMSERIVFISKNLYQYYEKELDKEKCRIIYNGISTDYLYPKYDDGIIDKGKKTTFLIAGNLHRNKKQNIAIDAAGILKQRGYDDFCLVIAGATSDMADSQLFEKELKAQAESLVPGYVLFTGFVKDMLELRKKTDIELVCSAREAFGRVTIEAMMCSNPVIASDSGANQELVKDGYNGFLFQEGNAVSLADKMERFLKETDLIRSLGESAYYYARENFTSGENTSEIEELYMSLQNI